MKTENGALACAHTRAHHAQAGAIIEVLRIVTEAENKAGKAFLQYSYKISVIKFQTQVFRTILRSAKLRAHKQLRSLFSMPQTGKSTTGVWGLNVRECAGNYSFETNRTETLKLSPATRFRKNSLNK
jgi:hypothetical protein